MLNTIFLLEGGHPPGSIIHLDSEVLVEMGIQWFNTLLLAAILAWILYTPVKKFLTNRADRIANQISEAKKAEQDAVALKEEYEGKLSGIETERQNVLDAARQRAQVNSDEILTHARQEASFMKERARNEIALAQDKVKDEMKKEIVDISLLLTGRFVSASLDRSTQDRLISEAFAQLEEVKWLG
jgi:F-type H+-transporting ATPase subunit b